MLAVLLTSTRKSHLDFCSIFFLNTIVCKIEVKAKYFARKSKVLGVQSLDFRLSFGSWCYSSQFPKDNPAVIVKVSLHGPALKNEVS